MSFYFLLLMCFFFFPIEWWVSFIPFIPCILISTFSHFFSIELCWGFGPQVLHRPRSFPSLAAGQCNTTTLVCDDEGVGGRREEMGEAGEKEKSIGGSCLSIFFHLFFLLTTSTLDFFHEREKILKLCPKKFQRKKKTFRILIVENGRHVVDCENSPSSSRMWFDIKLASTKGREGLLEFHVQVLYSLQWFLDLDELWWRKAELQTVFA